MKDRDWQKAFGRAPDQFLDYVDEALDRLEEETGMKRRYKASVLLIAAALIVLMAGAAAAVGFGLVEGVNRRGLITLLPDAENMVESNLGMMETELVDVRVEAAVYDGRSAFVQLRLTPKNPAEYALLAMEGSDPGVERGEYIFTDGWEIDGSYRRLVGRLDGKKVIRYDVNAFLSTIRLYFWRIEENEDGSMSVWLEGETKDESTRETARLNIRFRWGVHGEFGPEDAPDYWDYLQKAYLPDEAEMWAEVSKSGDRTKIRLEAAGESENGMLKFIGGSIEFTPLRGYLDIMYDYEGVDEDESLIVTEFLDAEGGRISSSVSGGTLIYDRRTELWYRTGEGAMQSFDPPPERLYLAIYDWATDREVFLDKIELKVIAE